MAQHQQQYVQVGAYPGATVYAYPGSQPAQVMLLQPGVPNPTTVQRKYNQHGTRASMVCGIIQLVIGCACICFQSVSLNLEPRKGSVSVSTSESVGTGIWCGILFLVTGILGICASKKNMPGLIVAFMVFNIISSLAVWTLLGFAVSDLTMIRTCQEWVISRGIGYNPAPCTDKLYSDMATMDGFVVALAVIEFIVAVTSSAFCCNAVCSCCRSNAGIVLQQPVSGVYLTTTTPNQQIVQQQQLYQQQQQQQQQYQQQLYQQSPGAGKLYPVQGGIPTPAMHGSYPQTAAAPAQYPHAVPVYSPYGHVTTAPANAAGGAAPQPYATQSAQQLPGAAYAVTAGHPQVVGGGSVTSVPYGHGQAMPPAQPWDTAMPSAPEAHLASPDMKAPFLLPDNNTAMKL